MTKLSLEHSGKFETKINKIIHRVSRSPDNQRNMVILRCRFEQDRIKKCVFKGCRHDKGIKKTVVKPL